jgi:acetyl-CoA carboxylase carboxyl transferase subunit beta
MMEESTSTLIPDRPTTETAQRPGRKHAEGVSLTMARKSGGPKNPWHGHFEPKRVPEGVWMRCDACGAMLNRKQVIENLNVCPECDHHFQVGAADRIAQLLDSDTFEEWFADLRPGDPLEFNDRRPYPERVKAEQERTGLNEAAVVGQGFIKGIRLVFGVTDSSFIMGSMGSVVGEKLTRAIEEATRQKLPIIIVSGSGGGARMHEGIYSLMQLAKVSQAIGRHNAAGGLYISVMTHPTMGGVAASFASLGDINLAEPKALIGFAGPKVIQQTVRVQLPEGFQTSEFLLEHGFLDRIVHRKDLRSLLAQLIDYVSP